MYLILYFITLKLILWLFQAHGVYVGSPLPTHVINQKIFTFLTNLHDGPNANMIQSAQLMCFPKQMSVKSSSGWLT